MIVTSPYRDTVSTKMVRNPELKQLAVVTISETTTEALSRHQDEEFTLFVEARNFPTVSWNVVGRQPGAPGARKVVIGAHYDTAPGIPEAWDNASGTAAVPPASRTNGTLNLRNWASEADSNGWISRSNSARVRWSPFSRGGT